MYAVSNEGDFYSTVCDLRLSKSYLFEDKEPSHGWIILAYILVFKRRSLLFFEPLKLFKIGYKFSTGFRQMLPYTLRRYS